MILWKESLIQEIKQILGIFVWRAPSFGEKRATGGYPSHCVNHEYTFRGKWGW